MALQSEKFDGYQTRTNMTGAQEDVEKIESVEARKVKRKKINREENPKRAFVPPTCRSHPSGNDTVDAQ